MNKKILLVSILSLVMLLTISFASAINTNTIDIERKETPLFKIRFGKAFTNEMRNIIEKIKTRFLGERIFFIPFYRVYRDETPVIVEYTEDCTVGKVCEITLKGDTCRLLVTTYCMTCNGYTWCYGCPPSTWCNI